MPTKLVAARSHSREMGLVMVTLQHFSKEFRRDRRGRAPLKRQGDVFTDLPILTKTGTEMIPVFVR